MPARQHRGRILAVTGFPVGLHQLTGDRGDVRAKPHPLRDQGLPAFRRPHEVELRLEQALQAARDDLVVVGGQDAFWSSHDSLPSRESAPLPGAPGGYGHPDDRPLAGSGLQRKFPPGQTDPLFHADQAETRVPVRPFG